MTYAQMSKLRKYVQIDEHAVDQFLSRISHSKDRKDATHRLANAYLRGDPIPVPSRKRVGQFFKYHEDVAYYRYGSIVVVAKESGPRYDKCEKTVVTCYPFKESKFDETRFD